MSNCTNLIQKKLQQIQKFDQNLNPNRLPIALTITVEFSNSSDWTKISSKHIMKKKHNVLTPVLKEPENGVDEFFLTLECTRAKFNFSNSQRPIAYSGHKRVTILQTLKIVFIDKSNIISEYSK